MMWEWYGIGLSLTFGIITAIMVTGILIVAVMFVVAIIMAIYEYRKGKRQNGI